MKRYCVRSKMQSNVDSSPWMLISGTETIQELKELNLKQNKAVGETIKIRQ